VELFTAATAMSATLERRGTAERAYIADRLHLVVDPRRYAFIQRFSKISISLLTIDSIAKS